MASNHPTLPLRIALPSKGALQKSTNQLLAACGLKVFRPSDRQYTGSISALPNSSILFQRAADIFAKVEEGSVDLGVTGYDVVAEHGIDQDNVIALYNNLGYGGCDLVLAVPESWVDVSSVEDLAELTLLFREKGQDIRIATKYPNVTRQWLYERRIVHFSLVEVQGAMEAAPSMGYADMIVDITSTGTTLRENRLKRLTGGTLLHSEACLIGNKQLLKADAGKLDTTGTILELIEAHLDAKRYISITANVHGQSSDEVGRDLRHKSELASLAGLRGPTISPVYSSHAEGWYAVTVVVQQNLLLAATKLLRSIGGTDITVFSPDYVFSAESRHYRTLLDELETESITH